jgi:hypothetical protein
MEGSQLPLEVSYFFNFLYWLGNLLYSLNSCMHYSFLKTSVLQTLQWRSNLWHVFLVANFSILFILFVFIILQHSIFHTHVKNTVSKFRALKLCLQEVQLFTLLNNHVIFFPSSSFRITTVKHWTIPHELSLNCKI